MEELTCATGDMFRNSIAFANYAGIRAIFQPHSIGIVVSGVAGIDNGYYQHSPAGDALAGIVRAPDVAARTYTLDTGDGTDLVIAVYRQSDRFGYAWNVSDPRQSEYGDILD